MESRPRHRNNPRHRDLTQEDLREAHNDNDAMVDIDLPPNASGSEIQTKCTSAQVQPHDALAYLHQRGQHWRRQLLRSLRVSNCTAYLAYLHRQDPALRPHFACVISGMSVVVDGRYGVLTPCCNRPIHKAALSTYEKGAACPGCDQLIKDIPAVTQEELDRYLEAYAAYKLLTASDRAAAISLMRGSLDDQSECPSGCRLNAAIKAGQADDAIMAMAREIAMAERESLQRSASAVLKHLHATPLTESAPLAKVTPGLSPRASAAPRKRPRTASAGRSGNDDVPIPPDAELPPPKDGGRSYRMYSDVQQKLTRFMLTKFSGSCPKCRGHLEKDRSFVGAVAVDGSSKDKWYCARCAFGLTSQEVLAVLVSGNLPEPQQAASVAATPDTGDIGSLFAL